MEKVLITGCSSGFGYQTALLLDKNKFDVTATTRRQGFVFENTTIKHLYLDMQHLPESFEDYDIVIFNAGILDAGLAELMEDKKIDEMMEVNVTSIMKMCKNIIPAMKAKKKGKLIFISSMAARRPLPNLAVYNASKAAIEAYAKSLYLELSYYGIDVYLIEPGYYPTSLWDDVKENTDEYSKILNSFGKNKKKFRDVKEVSFQILKICEGKYHSLHSTFGITNKLVVLCKPFIYTKMGKSIYKSILFKFQNMKTQKK